MCSVVGYIGKGLSRAFILDGLRRLGFRSYDFAGFACLSKHDTCLACVKNIGTLDGLLSALEKETIDGHVGIGYTRWATHESVAQQNAHPHFDCEKTIAVVHNGIIENWHELKEKLEQAGHQFVSTTDTEVIAKQFEVYTIAHATLKGAVLDLVNTLSGAYACLMIMQDQPDGMILVRKRSPLCIGIGDDELFVSCDPLAFAGKTTKILFLPDESFALIHRDAIELYDFNGHALSIKTRQLSADCDIFKQADEHQMLKEIYEQKEVIQSTVDFLKHINADAWNYMGIDAEFAMQLKELHMLGCGTAFHAGSIARYFFEYITKIPSYVHSASDFKFRPFFPAPNSLFVAICPSGETVDTLEAMRMVQLYDKPTVALCNVASSTMVREAGGLLLTQAGHKNSESSTKIFTAQLAVLYWLAHKIAIQKGLIGPQVINTVCEDLLIVARVSETCVQNYKIDIIQSLARELAGCNNVIFLGCHESYPFACQAALKLQEAAGLYTAAYSVGELQHGPLAFIGPLAPVFVFATQDPCIYQKLLASIQEVKAKGGRIIVFAFEDQKELQALADTLFIIPKVKPFLGAIAMSGLVQFLIYQIAKELGRPIDKTRNNAKLASLD